jgi:hypothetical protein
MTERRAYPRINLGRLNYEAVMKVLGDRTPPSWEELSLRQRAALSAAAIAVVEAARTNERGAVHDADGPHSPYSDVR